MGSRPENNFHLLQRKKNPAKLPEKYQGKETNLKFKRRPASSVYLNEDAGEILFRLKIHPPQITQRKFEKRLERLIFGTRR
jgi:hypothetical protein